MTGGQAFAEGSNQRDALVLGPQILHRAPRAGAWGRGSGKSAEFRRWATRPALADLGRHACFTPGSRLHQRVAAFLNDFWKSSSP